MRNVSAIGAWLGRAARRVQPIDGAFLAAPLALFGILVVACRWCGADLVVSRWFYESGRNAWSLSGREPWQFLYEKGCLPALLLGAVGLLAAVAGACGRGPRRWGRCGLFLVATLLLGPGLLVNLALKPYFGRPRPCETAPFGGDKQFVAVGRGLDRSDSRSFPSGHAAAAFFLATPALLYYRSRPGWAVATLAAGLGYGTLMGLARIGQGAHFASDVLASGFCVQAVATAVLAVVRRGDALPDWSTTVEH